MMQGYYVTCPFEGDPKNLRSAVAIYANDTI